MEEVVDVGIAAVGVAALGIDERFHAAGGIARVPDRDEEQPAQLLLLPGGEEGSALHGAHLQPDADRAQIVQRGLGHREERRRRHELSGVDPFGIASLGEELLGLDGVVGHGRRGQREVHDARDDDPRRRAIAQAGHLVDGLAVERIVDGQPHPLVGPRRLWIPLVPELDPVDRRVLRGHQAEPRVPPHVLGVLAIEGVGDVGLAVLQHRHARGPFGHALHDHTLDVGRVAPVPRIRLEHDFDPGLVADEPIRAGADGILAEPIVPDLGEVLLRDDEPPRGGSRSVERHEVGPRLLQVEADGQGIDDLHQAHMGLQLL